MLRMWIAVLIFSCIGTAVYGMSDDSHFFKTRTDIIKIFDDYSILEDEIVSRDLKIIGGDLLVSGTINGQITVIGGDVRVTDTAVVNGRIVVLGGNLDQNPGAEIFGEIIEVNQETLSISRDDEDHDDEFEDEDCRVFSRRSEPYQEELWARYNRSEGVYLQFNFTAESDFNPPSVLYGGLGRSFHRNKYYGVIGFEQRFLKDRLQFYIEGYDRSKTNDTDRICDVTNSLAALFIHEDFLDWYHVSGYQAGGWLTLPYDVQFFGEYTREDQSRMKTVVSWSMFGGDKEFRDLFPIIEGTDEFITYGLTIGTPYVWQGPDELSAMVSGRVIESLSDSDFDYRKNEITVDAFLPFKRDVGFHFYGSYGGMVSDFCGPQHKYYLGGIGSVRGYRWKEFGEAYENSHYIRTTTELIYDDIALFYDRGVLWENSEDTIDWDYVDHFQSGHAIESVGLSFGDDIRVDVIKPIGKGHDRDLTFNITIMDFD